MLPPSSATKIWPDAGWTVTLSTASRSPPAVAQSWKTASAPVAGVSCHTRRSPFVVNHTVPPDAQMPSPPLKAVVDALRSGADADVGIQVTTPPDTAAAYSCPAVRSPGVL